MATSAVSIQALYVAYFNRPADYFGLSHWQAIADTKGLAYVANEFSKSPEYTAQYAGKSLADSVDQIYVNLFGRHAEADGLVHWVNLLNSGVNNMGDIALAISQGAQNADLVAVNAKVDAAATFTNSLAGNADAIRGYDGAAANAVAVSWLTPITNTVTHDAAISASGLAAVTANVIQAHNVGSVNSSTNLAVGVDSLTGTAGNDVFNALSVDATGAAATTLSTFDSIDGGAGVDTLNIYVDTGNTKNQSLPASAVVKNVENINIFNDSSTTFTTGTGVEANKFVGATNITQIGFAGAVTGLASSTIAGFKSIAAGTLSVTAAAAATSATVQLTSVDDATGLTVLGGATGKLGTVTIIGAVTDSASDGVDAINVAVTVGKDVQTATVNSTVDIVLDVNDGAGTKVVTTVNAGGSTGAIKYVGGNTTVSSITTGTGADEVELTTAFSSTVKTASVVTGAGDDTIVVNVDSTGGTGTVTIDAGAGDDIINLTPVALVGGDKIDGGAGVDTLKLANAAALVAGDYVLFDATISNVEKLEFANAVTSSDGSQLSQFSTLIFDAAGVITKASQALVTHATALDATAVGYSVSGTGVITYAGNLDVTTDKTGGTLTLKGDTATVHVDALDSANTAITAIQGQLKTKLTVDTSNSINAAGTTDYLASAAVKVDATDNKGLTAITLTGDGFVTVNASAAVALATVDASGLGGKLAATGSEGNITGGLIFTGNAANAETITLGSGHDLLTMSSSTYGKLDTITGFDAVKETAGLDSVVDTLVFGGLTIDGATAATITKMTLAPADTSLALAFVHAAAVSNGTAVVQFQFGGNTYLFQDSTGAGVLDNADFAIKLTGAVDLTTAFGVHV